MNWVLTHTDLIILVAVFGTATCGYYFGKREVQNDLEADIQHVLHENETLREVILQMSGDRAGSAFRKARE